MPSKSSRVRPPAPRKPPRAQRPGPSRPPASPLTPADPHDRFFAFVFGQKEHGVGLLRAALPSALGDRLGWDSLKRLPADFIDADLRWRFSDLLFSVPIRDTGDEALVYVLIEHQSEPHPLMPLRVLRYLVRIWDEHLKGHPTAKHLPLIVPLVVYHGADRWTASRSLRDMLTAPASVVEAVAEHVPDFRFRLIDLRHADADALLGHLLSSFGEVALWAMTAAGDDAAVLAGISRFCDVLSDLLSAPDGHAALQAFLRYILATHQHIDRSELRRAVGDAVSPKAESHLMTMLDQLIEEGRQEGCAQTFLVLLAAKFGRVPADVRARVRAASARELTTWTPRVLRARALESVFTAPGRRRPTRPSAKKKP